MMTNAQAALIAAATWCDAISNTETDVLQTAHEWTMYLNGRQDADGGVTSAPQEPELITCGYCGVPLIQSPSGSGWVDYMGRSEHLTYNGHQTAPHHL